MKFPLSKDYCALIFSTIDIRCNRFAGPLTAKREVNSTIAIMSIRGINGTLHAKCIHGNLKGIFYLIIFEIFYIYQIHVNQSIHAETA